MQRRRSAFGAALLLIKPGLMTDLVGAVLLGSVLISQQAFKGVPSPLPVDRPGE